ncbi:MAG TPA: hypothetical protein VGN72_04930 [Tepidisphaeraceae bacterium]|jgi:hypothetical protein|nr:hypothetical protein [Tepidisphaeraceae bacterium]
MLETAKYVTLEDGRLEVPVIFPAHVRHARVAAAFNLPVASAGFCTTSSLPSGELHVDAFGHSESLNIGCRQQDGALLREMLQPRRDL